MLSPVVQLLFSTRRIWNYGKRAFDYAEISEPLLTSPYSSLTSNALAGEQVLAVSSFDKTQERTTFQLPRNLPTGSKAELKIAFSGEITGNMMGYYKSSWEHEGKTKHYALTQFEVRSMIHSAQETYTHATNQPTAARRAFPCWDEPLLKATFAVTMISRADTVSLSNMPAISEQPLEAAIESPSDLAELLSSTQNEKWKITKFETTPPMSTYIVAFANGHFEHLETSVVMPLSKKTIPLRIYGQCLFVPIPFHDSNFCYSYIGYHSSSTICA